MDRKTLEMKSRTHRLYSRSGILILRLHIDWFSIYWFDTFLLCAYLFLPSFLVQLALSLLYSYCLLSFNYQQIECGSVRGYELDSCFFLVYQILCYFMYIDFKWSFFFGSRTRYSLNMCNIAYYTQSPSTSFIFTEHIGKHLDGCQQ